MELTVVPKPRLENGVLNLRDYDLEHEPPVGIHGMWEFYPLQFNSLLEKGSIVAGFS